MKFRSTRGGGQPVSFYEALLRGPAEDGGLYLPVEAPQLPSSWQDAGSLPEVARAVLPPLMGEEGAAAVAEALDFPVPLVDLGRDYLLELFHGPTSAFKDVGARSLARLMEAALEQRGGSATVLVATSGDTGGAVADAFAGLEHVQVALLYPAEGVSRVQENQLIAERRGLRAFAVKGTFDDCQRMVKEAFQDPALSPLNPTSANSINVGRLLPQMLYYLWALAQARRRLGRGERLTFVVPSGNLGNLTAGLLATTWAGAEARFVAAHNRNDYFTRFLAGQAAAYDFAPSVTTRSNAMDVGAPSNFERLYALFGEDLPAHVMGEAVDDAATLRRMRLTFEEHGYLACPHTAVGLEAWHRVRQRLGDGDRAVVLATAHPAKFPESVREATGVTPEAPAALAAFEDAPKRVEPVAPTLAALREALLAQPVFSA